MPGEFAFLFLSRSRALRCAFGTRRDDGTAVYAHYQNIEPMLLVVGLLGILGGVLKFGVGVGDFPLTPVVLGPPLLIGWWWFRSQRREQQQFFDTHAA